MSALSNINAQVAAAINAAHDLQVYNPTGIGNYGVGVGCSGASRPRSRTQWLELSMDDLWTEWLSSGDQTFDEWYVANIPAPDIST